MECPSCHGEINGKTSFCPRCGAQLPSAPEKPRREGLSWQRAVFGTAGASILALLLLRTVTWAVQLVMGYMLGDGALMGYSAGVNVVGLWSSILVWGGHVAFTALGMGNQSRRRAPWLITWGVLCGVGMTLWLLSLVFAPTLMRLVSDHPEVLTGGVATLRWYGLLYGLGFPILQGALVVNLWGRGFWWKTPITLVVFAVTTLVVVWLGVWVLHLGVSGLVSLVAAPLLAAIPALLLGMKNGTPRRRRPAPEKGA